MGWRSSRSGKHLTHITPAGEAIIEMAGEILRQTESIKRIAQDHSDNVSGSMSLATTHGQARYVLPDSISRFSAEHPEVSLEMRQGSPQQIAEMAAKGSVDFAIATEALQQYASLVTLPFFRWSHCVVVPSGHPLAALDSPTLEQIAHYPSLPTPMGLRGGSALTKGLKRVAYANYVVTAADADVIKTYVRKEWVLASFRQWPTRNKATMISSRLGRPIILLHCCRVLRSDAGLFAGLYVRLHRTARSAPHSRHCQTRDVYCGPEERNEFCARLEVPRI